MSKRSGPRRDAADKPEKAAVEKRLEQFLDVKESNEEPLPVLVRIELLERDLQMWRNTLKHTKELYGLACEVKDEQRKGELWAEALRCFKWKEQLEHKISALKKQVKKEPVDIPEGQQIIEES